MTSGLLSNVALKSLGEIRNNTHQILSKFHSGLDASFITHKVLTNPPEETERHAVPLIASEIADILESYQSIRALLDNKMIKTWLELQIKQGLNFDGKIGDIEHEKVLSLVENLLENGVESSKSRKTGEKSWDEKITEFQQKPDPYSFFTNLFSSFGEEESHRRDLEFANLTSIRSRYNDEPLPVLTLGSVIKEKVGEKYSYLICIQPLCDSVRLKNVRKFLFLSAKKKQNGKFNIAVKEGDDFIKLCVDFNSHNAELIEFLPHKERQEVVAKLDGDFLFFSSAGKRTFEWVADLKFPHAQRIVTQFSEKLGRVGLNESDWLRRLA
jgi:hypothetical protein